MEVSEEEKVPSKDILQEWIDGDDLNSYLHIWIDSGYKHSSPNHIDVSIHFYTLSSLEKGSY